MDVGSSGLVFYSRWLLFFSEATRDEGGGNPLRFHRVQSHVGDDLPWSLLELFRDDRFRDLKRSLTVTWKNLLDKYDMGFIIVATWR